MQYLQETSRLASWLDKATEVQTKVENAENGHHLDADTERALDELNTDEDAIEAGINKLLDTIKDVHFPIEDATAAQPEETETKQAAAKQVLKVPLPRLEKKLRGYVTTHLEKVQSSLDKMKATGQVVDTPRKRQIDHYLHAITAHLLKSYLTYEDWTDAKAMKEEAGAIEDGDAELPSRIQTTQTMAKKDIVEHFIAAVWRKPQTQPVPKAVSAVLTGQIIALPGGGHVQIVMGTQ